MKCKICGAQNDDSSLFCSECGNKLIKEESGYNVGNKRIKEESGYNIGNKSIKEESGYNVGNKLIKEESGTNIGNNSYSSNNGSNKRTIIAILIPVIIIVLILVFIIAYLLGKTNKLENNNKNNQVENQTNIATEEVTPVPTEEPTPTPEPTLSPEEVKYNNAVKLFKKDKYKIAANKFKSLGKYKKSKEYYKRSKYLLAVSYYKGQNYKKAKAEFSNLGNYKSSKNYITNCDIKLFTSKKIANYGWKDTTDPYAPGDGFTMTVSWEYIDGAEGYEINEGEHEGEWYYRTEYTTTNSFSTSFSSVNQLSASVRAYKTIGGKRYYTPWSANASWQATW